MLFSGRCSTQNFSGVEVPASTTSQFATSPGDDTELSRAALLLRSRTMCLGSDSEVFAGHLLGAVFIISMEHMGTELNGWVGYSHFIETLWLYDVI